MSGYKTLHYILYTSYPFSHIMENLWRFSNYDVRKNLEDEFLYLYWSLSLRMMVFVSGSWILDFNIGFVIRIDKIILEVVISLYIMKYGHVRSLCCMILCHLLYKIEKSEYVFWHRI